MVKPQTASPPSRRAFPALGEPQPGKVRLHHLKPIEAPARRLRRESDSADLGLCETFQLPRRMQLQFRVEALNALDYTVLWNSDVNPRNSTFGYISQDRNSPRDIQLDPGVHVLNSRFAVRRSRFANRRSRSRGVVESRIRCFRDSRIQRIREFEDQGFPTRNQGFVFSDYDGPDGGPTRRRAGG
jgi:hypothetical protein